MSDFTEMYVLMFFNTGWDWNASQGILWGVNLKYSQCLCFERLVNLDDGFLDYAEKSHLHYIPSIVP